MYLSLPHRYWTTLRQSLSRSKFDSSPFSTHDLLSHRFSIASTSTSSSAPPPLDCPRARKSSSTPLDTSSSISSSLSLSSLASSSARVDQVSPPLPEETPRVSGARSRRRVEANKSVLRESRLVPFSMAEMLTRDQARFDIRQIDVRHRMNDEAPSSCPVKSKRSVESQNVQGESSNCLEPENMESWIRETFVAHPSSLHALRSMVDYINEFLALPHALVGRDGPVCPWVPSAKAFDSLFLGVVRLSHLPKSEWRREIFDITGKYIHYFESLEPKSGVHALKKAIVLCFPDVSLSEARELIDGTQLELKPELVSRGYMIGEFHLLNNTPGLRNSEFFPLRTPLPCLAMRHMVPTDIVFLDMDAYDPYLREQLLISYIDRFETHIASVPAALLKQLGSELDIAKAALERARQELAKDRILF